MWEPLSSELDAGAADLPRLPPGYIGRPRLRALLDRLASSSSVLVLRAGTGSGKTALLTEWARHRPTGEHVAWMTLDEQTCTATGFWPALARLLTGRPSLDLASPATVAAEVNQTRRPMLIVLDDFHLVSPTTESEVATFAGLLRRGRVAIATRRCTVLESALHGVTTAVATVTADELAFTTDEVAELVDDGAGDRDRQQPEVEAAAVLLATGGHTLLTRLVVMSDDDDPAVAATRLVAEWLNSEIDRPRLALAAQLAESPVVDATLASLIVPHDESGNALAELADDGLGTLDADRGHFEFYEIVAASLRQHADSIVDPDALDRARSIIAERFGDDAAHAAAVFRVLARSGRVAELRRHFATYFAELTDDPADAARLFVDLPADVVRANGTLGVIAAVVHSMHEPRPSLGLESTVGIALDNLRRRPPVENPEEEFMREVAALALQRAIRDFDNAAITGRRLARLAGRLDATDRARLAVPVASALVSAAAVHTLNGDLHGAERILLLLGSELDDRWSTRRHVLRAVVFAIRGEIAAAVDVFDNDITQPPESPRWATRYAISRAAVELEAGHPRRARKTLLEITPDLAFGDDWPWMVVVMARSHLADDPLVGIEDVDRLLDQHRQRPVATRVRDLLDSAVADLAVGAGDLRRAMNLVERRQQSDVALSLSAARIALITGDPSVVGELRRLVRRTRVWPRLRAQGYLLLAVHLFRAGQQRAASDALKRAVTISNGHRLRLIHALIPRSELEAIAAVGGGIELPVDDNAPNPLEPMLAPLRLTGREQALLEQLAGTSTLRAIADSEFRSLSTIKSQAASLYRKLGVHSRADAVDVAFRRGLLS